MHTVFGLVRHTVVLSNSPGTDGRSIAILNQVDITSESNKVMSELVAVGSSEPRLNVPYDLKIYCMTVASISRE